MKRKGRPRKNGKTKPYNNGWFMVSVPSSGRIVAVSQMVEPENNSITFATMEKALKTHTKVDCMILDRACKVQPQASREKLCPSIKYWVVDKFHANKDPNKGHSPDCHCNPYTVARLGKRVKFVNTSRAESVFSWFRGYARTFNEMRKERHSFIVLYYVRLHNELLSKGDASHLCGYHTNTFKVKASVPYSCRTRSIMKKVMKKGKALSMKAAMRKVMKKATTASMKKAK